MSLITIAVAANNSYVQHLGVMLYSLFSHNQDVTFCTYLLNNGITEENKRSLDYIGHRFQNELCYETIDVRGLPDVKADDHVSVETYFRLLIPAVLPKSVSKVLYLDADIIVKGRVVEFWNTDISHYFLAAVSDVTVSTGAAPNSLEEYAYFNAGVMLMDLKAWRDHAVTTQCLNFMQTYPEKITFWDQDALNAILRNKWLPVHPKYNMQGPLFMDEFKSYYGDPEQLQEAMQDPIIIHYSAPQKPWHYLSYHPYTQEYSKYLALTPWKGYRPEDKTLVRILRKAVRPYLRKAGITKVLGKHLY